MMPCMVVYLYSLCMLMLVFHTLLTTMLGWYEGARGPGMSMDKEYVPEGRLVVCSVLD